MSFATKGNPNFKCMVTLVGARILYLIITVNILNQIIVIFIREVFKYKRHPKQIAVIHTYKRSMPYKSE